MKNVEKNKFKLAKITIIAMIIAVSAIAMTWLILKEHPISLKVSADFDVGAFEIDCKFASEKSTE